MSRKLKGIGKVFIKEHIGKGYGISIEEIRRVMTKAELRELKFKTTKTMFFGPIYEGVFRKAENV